MQYGAFPGIFYDHEPSIPRSVEKQSYRSGALRGALTKVIHSPCVGSRYCASHTFQKEQPLVQNPCVLRMVLLPLSNNAFNDLHITVFPTNIANSQLLHHSCIIDSTSFDSARHCFRRPEPCFLVDYTPPHSSGEREGSGEGA